MPYQVFVANAETKAHSTYSPWAVFGLDVFYGQRVAQMSDGFHLVTGDNDNDTDIDSAVYWPPSALGNPKQKTVEKVTMHLAGSGAEDGTVVMIADDTERREFSMPLADNSEDVSEQIVKGERGLSASFWQIGYENNGADFELLDADVVTIVTGRDRK